MFSQITKRSLGICNMLRKTCNSHSTAETHILPALTSLIGRRLGSSSSSSSSSTSSQPESPNDKVNPKFINRNPRNLEMMNLAKKRMGWKYQCPSPYFYHRLSLDISGRSISAQVEDCWGKPVVTATTNEYAISRYLHSKSDVSAAENIGRVIAMRCKENGILSMEFLAPHTETVSDKLRVFYDAVVEGGIQLEEDPIIKPEYEPGIDYEDKEAMAELERRQLATTKRLSKVRHIKQVAQTARSRARTHPLRNKNINRNRGFTTQGKLLGYHMMFHKHQKHPRN